MSKEQKERKARTTRKEIPMTASPEEPDRIEELSKKIHLAQGKVENKQDHSTSHKNIGYAWRMVLELVIGMLLGFGIGFSLDQWFQTSPLMIIIMSLFGFAAGIRTMIKTANEFTKIEDKKRLKEL
jgi:ATP synthase protein I